MMHIMLLSLVLRYKVIYLYALGFLHFVGSTVPADGLTPVARPSVDTVMTARLYLHTS